VTPAPSHEDCGPLEPPACPGRGRLEARPPASASWRASSPAGPRGWPLAAPDGGAGAAIASLSAQAGWQAGCVTADKQPRSGCRDPRPAWL